MLSRNHHRVSTLLLVAVLLGLVQLQAVSPQQPSNEQVLKIQSQPVSPQQRAAALSSLSKQPVRFEQNVGQLDEQIRYYAQVGGYTALLTNAEVELVLPVSPTNALVQPGTSQPDAAAKAAANVKQQRTSLHYKLENANPQAELIGEQELAGKSNYFIGKDATKWHPNVPSYARVVYHNAYPGIDVAYYGDAQNQLEHDFIVAAGADPGQIHFSIVGAERTELVGGELLIHTEAGVLQQHAPRVYQEGPDGRHEVSTSYSLLGSNEFGFTIAAYDRSQSLVIDPVLVYASYLGGSGADRINGIYADKAGNVYLAGDSASLDFPIHNAYQPGYAGSTSYNAFVTKLSNQGTTWVYSTYLSGDGGANAARITADEEGAAYVIGQAGLNFPAEMCAPFVAGGSDTFVTKLSANGSNLDYSTLVGGNNSTNGVGITLDAAHHAYVSGYTYADNFYATTILAPLSLYNYFVVELNTDGRDAIYSTILGPGFASVTAGGGIAVDSTGNAYVTGNANNNFPTTAGAFQQSYGGGSGDGFVAKLNPQGSAFVYATYLGGTSTEYSNDIAVDGNGNAYVVGATSSNNFPFVPAIHQTSYDAFFVKLNAAGSRLGYAVPGGSTYSDFGASVAVDELGTASYVGLYSYLSGFYVKTYGFVNRLGTTGEQQGFYSLSGNNNVQFQAVAVDKWGDTYFAGETTATDLPSVNAVQGTYAGNYDGYLGKVHFDPSCTPGTSGTKRNEDELGYDSYQTELSCNAPSSKMEQVTQGRSFTSTLMVNRYYGWLVGSNPATGDSPATGTISPTQIGLTVSATAELRVWAWGLQPGGVVTITLNTMTPLTFTHLGLVPYFTATVPISSVILPRRGELQIAGEIITSTGYYTERTALKNALPPPDASNAVSMSFNSYKESGPLKPNVNLRLKGLRPLVLENGFEINDTTPQHHVVEAQLRWWWHSDERHSLELAVPGIEINRPRDVTKDQFIYFAMNEGHGSIAEGGERLAQEIYLVAKAYGVDRVNLVGFSMGGLWSREAVTRKVGNTHISNKVDHLIMIGTPNKGSFWANDGLGVYLACLVDKANPFCAFYYRGYYEHRSPAIGQLTSSFLQDYNKSSPEHRTGVNGVSYYALAGKTRGAFVTDDDGVVTVDSVYALSDYVKRLPSVEIVWDIVTVGASHYALAQSEEVLANIKPLLLPQANNGDEAFSTGPIPLQGAESSLPVQSPASVGLIQAGQVVTYALTVDGADEIRLSSGWIHPSITLELTLYDPQGHPITPTNNYTDSVYSTTPNGSQYVVEHPIAGTWLGVVRPLTMTTGITEPFYLLADFKGGVQLNPEVSTPAAAIGQPVLITSTLVDSATIAGATVTATVFSPISTVQDALITLTYRGNGVYSQSYTPLVEGTYNVSIYARGQNTFGQSFNRTTSTSFQASSAATFNGSFTEQPYDTDGDVYSNTLVVTAEVHINQPGQYRLGGSLTSADGTIVATADDFYTASASTTQLPFTFDGSQIARSLKDGPYQLSNLYVARTVGGEEIKVAANLTATTRAYSRYTWQRANVLQAARAAERGIDDNHNGRYEYLEVNVPVDVRAEGVYNIAASLTDTNTKLITTAYTSTVNAISGTLLLTLRFSGGEILNSGVNGPYQVIDLDLNGPNPGDHTPVRLLLRRTAAYRSTDFEAAIVGTPTPTPSSTATPTNTATATPTRTSTRTPSSTGTATNTSTVTSTPTNTPLVTATPTPRASAACSALATPPTPINPVIPGSQDHFSGFICNDAGNAIVGAIVKLYMVHYAGRDAKPVLQTTTDSDGHWSFYIPVTSRNNTGSFYGYDVVQSPVPAGYVNLLVDIASGTGYRSVPAESSVRWSIPYSSLPFSSNDQVAFVVAQPSGASVDRFSGYVRTDGGSPVANARVLLYMVHYAGRDAVPMQASTADSNGHWSFYIPLTSRNNTGSFYGYDVVQAPSPPGCSNLRVDISGGTGYHSVPVESTVRWSIYYSGPAFSSIDQVTFQVTSAAPAQ